MRKKKIGRELDKLTGRKTESVLEKRKKQSKKDVDPSSISSNIEKRLPDIYITKEGMGFFGYIFLLIVVAFSLIGLLKTFETDLLNNFPEIEYIFEILDEQLIYISETVKNIIPSEVKITSIRQENALGLGHAILCAKDLVNEEETNKQGWDLLI